MRTWTLRGATTSYVVGVPDHGGWAELVAWGPAGVSDGPSTVSQQGTVHFVAPADLAPLEYAVRGVRYTSPAELVVLRADGADECRPVFVADASTQDGLALTFEDPVVRLVLHYRMPAGLDVVERWVTVEALADVVLHAHDSAAFVVPTTGGARLRYLWGEWSHEFQQASADLSHGRFEIGSRQGVAGHSFSPHLSVEEDGTAWGVQLAWSGSWHLTADVDVTGQTRLQAGRAAATAGLPLRAGETWTSPVAVGGCSTEGPDGLARVFHAYQRHLAGPRLSRPRPVVYNSWEATGFDVRFSHQLELAAIAAEVGVETFVVDDGWFTGRHDDTAGLGDWYVDDTAFPTGLDDFITRLHGLGLEFGLWVEPESVSPGSELAAKHPDWILRTPGLEPLLVRNQLLLDLGRDDVAEWVWETLDRLLTTYDISYLKWDANRARLDSGVRADVDGAVVANLYRVLDRLRADHPDVYLEGCSGGGARVDLGTAARVDTLWPSDNTAPLDRLRIQRGFLSAWAPHLMSSWVSDATGLHDTRPRDLDFRFHVAMAGGLGIGADLSAWSAEQLATARHWVGVYRCVRNMVASGSVHRLGSGPVDGLQYRLGDRSLVLLYDTGSAEVGDALPSRPRRIPLTGLDPDLTYRAGDEVLSGRYLLTAGIPAPPASGSRLVLVEPSLPPR